MTAFVDTNVLVYAVDTGEPAKRERALAVLAERADGGLMISTQVLLEFYATVTRKLAHPLDDAATAIERLARWPVVPADVELVKSAIEISEGSRLSVWDGMIIAAAAAGGCATLLSEDLSHDQRIAGVLIENPFAN